MIVPLLAPALTGPVTVAATSCSGSDLAIVSAVAHRMPDTAHATYAIKVTVINRGSSAQRGNVLQSISMIEDGSKVDSKGIPPLGPGQTYTYKEHFVRAVDADDNSTEFRFVPHRDSPSLGSNDCLGSPFPLTV